MFRQFIAVSILVISIAACSNDAQPTADNIVPKEDKTMDSITTQIAKARQFQEKGQYAEAMTIANAMIKKYPGQLDALSIKAEILKEQGKSDEALAILEEAYTLQPRDKETAYNLAFEYADAKNTKALPLTDTLIKYDKTATVARAWYIKATYYNNIGDQKEAMRFYDSSLAADFNFLDAYMDKGQLQFNQKKYEAALKTFALGQKFSPSTAEFYYWVAKCQEVLGNKADAKTNYERAFGLNPSFTEAKTAAEKL